MIRACVVDCGGIDGQAEGFRVGQIGVRRDAPEFAIDEVDHRWISLLCWGGGCVHYRICGPGDRPAV